MIPPVSDRSAVDWANRAHGRHGFCRWPSQLLKVAEPRAPLQERHPRDQRVLHGVRVPHQVLVANQDKAPMVPQPANDFRVALPEPERGLIALGVVAVPTDDDVARIAQHSITCRCRSINSLGLMMWRSTGFLVR